MIFFALTVTQDTIEDIRGPFLTDNVAWSIAIIAVLLLLAAIAYFFWPEAKPKVAPVPLPRELARTRLSEVKARSENVGIQDLAVALSNIVRTFLEQQYGLKTISRTTQEFLTELANTSCLSPVQKSSLQRFLLTIDQVKFARITPSGERAELVGQATELIEQTP